MGRRVHSLLHSRPKLLPAFFPEEPSNEGQPHQRVSQVGDKSSTQPMHRGRRQFKSVVQRNSLQHSSLTQRRRLTFHRPPCICITYTWAAKELPYPDSGVVYTTKLRGAPGFEIHNPAIQMPAKPCPCEFRAQELTIGPIMRVLWGQQRDPFFHSFPGNGRLEANADLVKLPQALKTSVQRVYTCLYMYIYTYTYIYIYI